jgi:hypothetical protein
VGLGALGLHGEAVRFDMAEGDILVGGSEAGDDLRGLSLNRESRCKRSNAKQNEGSASI